MVLTRIFQQLVQPTAVVGHNIPMQKLAGFWLIKQFAACIQVPRQRRKLRAHRKTSFWHTDAEFDLSDQ